MSTKYFDQSLGSTSGQQVALTSVTGKRAQPDGGATMCLHFGLYLGFIIPEETKNYFPLILRLLDQFETFSTKKSH